MHHWSHRRAWWIVLFCQMERHRWCWFCSCQKGQNSLSTAGNQVLREHHLLELGVICWMWWKWWCQWHWKQLYGQTKEEWEKLDKKKKTQKKKKKESHCGWVGVWGLDIWVFSSSIKLKTFYIFFFLSGDINKHLLPILPQFDWFLVFIYLCVCVC